MKDFYLLRDDMKRPDKMFILNEFKIKGREGAGRQV